MRPAILFLSCLAAQALTLQDLENMALRGNPSLPQAAAAARSAEALRQQAGLYPNPMVGYTGNEINSGSVFNYGEHGVFLEQRIVTGGKLGIAKKVAEQSVAQSEAERAAQRQRVLNAVRSLYYQALGEQRLLETRKELAAIAAPDRADDAGAAEHRHVRPPRRARDGGRGAADRGRAHDGAERARPDVAAARGGHRKSGAEARAARRQHRGAAGALVRRGPGEAAGREPGAEDRRDADGAVDAGSGPGEEGGRAGPGGARRGAL